VEGRATTSLIEARRSHPAYDRIFRIYRNAIVDWHASGAIQNAARTMGMDARGYADSRIRANQFSWPSNNTSDPLTWDHFDTAYKDAVNDVCGVSA
jgi:hypothetical protein